MHINRVLFDNKKLKHIPMKKKKYYLVTILLLSIFTINCNKNSGTSANEQDTTSKVYPVKTIKLKKETIQRTIEQSATLIPFEQVYLAPAQPGRIEKVLVEEGNRVYQGQVVVQMDKTQFHQAKLQLSSLETDFRRLDTLHQYGSISEQKYDEIKTQLKVAQTNVNFLSDNTQLKSPLNGIVTEKYYDDGEMYGGAPNTKVGKAAILTLMQINPVKAVINVSETYFPSIKTGMKANLTCDIYAGKTFEGQVYRISPIIDPSSRTFEVEIQINNAKEELRPGMFTRVSIDLFSLDAILIPTNVITQQEGTNKKYVFINENGLAKRVNIEEGQRFNDKVEVISEIIKEGSDLITAGYVHLMDNSKVKVVE